MGALGSILASLVVAVLNNFLARADFRAKVVGEADRQGATRALEAAGWQLGALRDLNRWGSLPVPDAADSIVGVTPAPGSLDLATLQNLLQHCTRVDCPLRVGQTVGL